MQEMHPDLSNQDLVEMYKGIMGQGERPIAGTSRAWELQDYKHTSRSDPASN